MAARTKRKGTRKRGKRAARVGLPAALRRDIVAVALLGLSALGFLSLAAPGRSGVLRLLARLVRAFVGGAAIALPACLLVLAIWAVFAPGSLVTSGRSRWLGVGIGLVAAAGFLHLGVPSGHAFALGLRGEGGGLLGAAVDWTLAGLVGRVGARIVLVTASVGAVLLIVQFSLARAVLWLPRGLVRTAVTLGRWMYAFVTEPVPEPATGEAQAAVAAAAPPSPPEPFAPALDSPPLVPSSLPGGAEEVEVEPFLVPPPPRHVPPGRPLPLSPGGLYAPPPFALLSRQVRGRSGPGHLPDGGQRAAQLEEALRSFGVDARVTGYTQGPTITRFEVQPGPGVKVSRIGALAQDLALGMRAVDVRVAPIPGKAAVGIEVPNSDVQAVPLRDVMETPDFQRAASPLAVCLGQDIAGKPVVASLESLLHVLVAGATGSGKSITINCMLMSILFKARPDQVKLVLIDPKRVELSQFEGTPHLMTPVVTDPRKAAATLRAVVKEMERRYGVFTEAGVRDIGRFNELAPGRGDPPLPFVVVVIDELADLMLVARSDVEDAIQRLTQMARAAGIHLIVATQRPSVDVITGVIKANIPTRIALAVSSQVDSRTILDAAGAEKLIGRGDMLFRPVGTQKLLRAQGAYVSEAEVEAVLKYLREHGQPDYDEVVSRADADGSGEETEDGEGDALFVDALRVVVESHQASVSNLQRRLRVGFTRAGRLVDMMEQRGYVGPHQGSKSREVLLTLDQFHRLYGDRANADG